MTVDEFLAWAEGREGRYELYNDIVYPMAPERAGRAEVKHAVASALATSIARAKLECWMLPDGMTVRVDKNTAHEPDALVYCGPKLPSTTIEVPSPVIVVEVLSPSTRHYLIVDPEKRLVIHHARGDGEEILTRIVKSGSLDLSPPGLKVPVAKLFAAP